MLPSSPPGAHGLVQNSTDVSGHVANYECGSPSSLAGCNLKANYYVSDVSNADSQSITDGPAVAGALVEAHEGRTIVVAELTLADHKALSGPPMVRRLFNHAGQDIHSSVS
jgi:hypothetical protein